jgi:hypothetical protein
MPKAFGQHVAAMQNRPIKSPSIGSKNIKSLVPFEGQLATFISVKVGKT